MPRRLSLPLQIVLGFVAGTAWSLLQPVLGLEAFTTAWIAPLGTLFLNLLKLLALPLVVASLLEGVAGVGSLARLSRLGGRTVAYYLASTVAAILVGIGVASVVRPGTLASVEQRERLQERYEQALAERRSVAEELQQKSPLQVVVEFVPENFLASAQDNRRMLQVILATLLFGIALTTVPAERIAPLRQLLQALLAGLLALVNIVMRMAPVGVFALMAGLRMDWSLLSALGAYSLSVLLGLGLMLGLAYPLALRFLAGKSVRAFYRALFPAQVVAFSTSSSAATLPTTLHVCRHGLGIRDDIAGFVLPLGATVNMDGTSLYQAVATLFIAQLYGIELGFGALLALIAMAVAASVGAAPVPGAGIVMLVLILQNLGLPQEGLALIVAVDRLLDMSRTVVNVTSDAVACVLVSAWERPRGEAA
ncbi:MAG: dicarboxylate/amino acid:cation symporter [Candidatus Kapabacteria bacterium]|nr:dicarboxylate/amino acid:cation symporter [Candidatus Kapabacteria bacterium]MDW8011371.1 dicarboxylate/amino acid:cation symporter [Bacteroidota bacterium]